MNNIAIKLTGVSKQYIIHHEKPTLVEKFVKTASAGWRIQQDERFWALKNINLTIKKGERVGIIGPNGSGKTTLLKIIAGITSPSEGNIEATGKIVSLIDLDAGFNLELSGYQNIYLNGLLLGMSKKNIDHKIKSIITFADVRQFIDAPLFTYSQGMKLRLGFSVAIHSDPDIIILDEGIGVGDDKFRTKTRKKIVDLFKSHKTVLVASHWLDFIKQNCTRIVTMENGKIIRN